MCHGRATVRSAPTWRVPKNGYYCTDVGVKSTLFYLAFEVTWLYVMQSRKLESNFWGPKINFKCVAACSVSYNEMLYIQTPAMVDGKIASIFLLPHSF